jgi:hypothetical protein
MKINTENGTFNVRWKYGNGAITLTKKNMPTSVERNITTCDISIKRPATDSELATNPEVKNVYDTLATGNAVVHPNDTFDKVVARQVSFRKAISLIPREQRKPLWDAFRSGVKQS